MGFSKLLASGGYRVSIAFIHLFDTAGSAHRSDYWGGDNTPISRDRNRSSSQRQSRWRRRRLREDEKNNSSD